jgi:flagellar biosynthesis anti-sigma factor FlgM
MSIDLFGVGSARSADLARVSSVSPAPAPLHGAEASPASLPAASLPEASLPEDHATLSTSSALSGAGDAPAGPASTDQSLQSLTVSILATGSTRASRLESLRNAIANGHYSVDAAAIAQAMIEESL